MISALGRLMVDVFVLRQLGVRDMVTLNCRMADERQGITDAINVGLQKSDLVTSSHPDGTPAVICLLSARRFPETSCLWL